MTDLETGGIRVQTYLSVVGVGSVLGAAYAVSPLTAWFVVACAAICWWAGRGLSPRERRWVLGLLTVAIALRVVTVMALFVFRDPSRQYFSSFFFDGDGMAYKLRSMWMASFWSGGRVDWFESHGAFDRSYGWSSYLQVLAYLQYVLGAAPYGIHLMNIALFAAGSVGLYRHVRVAYGRLPALAGFAFLLFLPTLFLWSIGALKESVVFFLMAATLLAALRALSSPAWRMKLIPGGVFLLAVAALSTTRQGVLELAAAAVVMGTVMAFIVRRRYVLVATVVLAVVGGYAGLRSEAVRSRISAQLAHSTALHLGNVRTEGHAYKTLDERFYASSYSSGEAVPAMTDPEAARFVIRSLISFIVVPVPWQVKSQSELFFLPTQMVWYGLVALAVVGFVSGLRRNVLLTSVFATYVLAGAMIVGLNSGNIGSLVRLRDIVTPFMVWLSGLGAVLILGRAAAGKAEASTRRLVGTAAPRRPIFATSVVLQCIHRFTSGSVACRVAREFVGRRNTSIDSSVALEREGVVAVEIRALARRSRLIRALVPWTDSWMKAWRESRATNWCRRHVNAFSREQVVRLVGVTLAAAVIVEALTSLGRLANSHTGPFDRGAPLFCLAVAGLFILANRAVAAAWTSRMGTPT